MFLAFSGAQNNANGKTEKEVQIRIFRDACFSLKYPGFPVHLEVNEIIYLEVEGR